VSQVRAVVTITGKVQGVYFRLATQEEARRYGVKGWVRNRPDGAVVAEFEGEQQAVQQVLSWCWQGPPQARVANVEVRWEPPTGTYSGFSILG
jgi:acylphosphatase